MEKLDDDALERIAGYFRALSVVARLKILNALRSGEHAVSELAALTGCTQANVSKHLSILSQAGLVQRSTRGTSAYYRILDPATYSLCDIVCGQIGKQYEKQASVQRMFAKRMARTGDKNGRAARSR